MTLKTGDRVLYLGLYRGTVADEPDGDDVWIQWDGRRDMALSSCSRLTKIETADVFEGIELEGPGRCIPE